MSMESEIQEKLKDFQKIKNTKEVSESIAERKKETAGKDGVIKSMNNKLEKMRQN